MGEIEPGCATSSADVPQDTGGQKTRVLGTGESLDEIKKDIPDMDGGATLTPLQEIEASRWRADRALSERKAKVFKMLNWFIPLAVSFIMFVATVFVGVFTYRISNLSEPIGYIKSDISNLKASFDEYKRQNEVNLTEIKNQITEERRQRENADAKK